ncbi:MAG: purine-binding chemotaxis protein CheW [Armatimonadetes bacterium]|nr:purine-binding chemotaxis protein CheW [Armatimonadota bacterium]
MATEAVLTAEHGQLAEAGQYLSFRLADEEYGVPILTVREIMGLQPITEMPQAPAAVLGVINLRGKVITVVDLRTLFGMPTAEHTPQSCIIVLDVADGGRTQQVGALVDCVAEVTTLAPDQIKPPPTMGDNDGAHIRGVGLLGQRVLLLLDAVGLLAQMLAPPPAGLIDL